ncbi:MAG: hypothetical protein NUW01_08185 [Gemmatimonadaceae bacterium]|nr:hypothetical protein [Gemmatimonadaceae bacterium]
MTPVLLVPHSRAWHTSLACPQVAAKRCAAIVTTLGRALAAHGKRACGGRACRAAACYDWRSEEGEA